MKITEQIKSCQAFAYGKLNGLNNRESARLCVLVPEGIDASKLSGYAIGVYLSVCKEPNVSAETHAHSRDGKPSRSKLVMAYEKQRKAFNKIVTFRNIQRAACDKVASSINTEELSASESPRLLLLAKLLSPHNE